jgi:two-component system sensor histidine kinase KdpD
MKLTRYGPFGESDFKHYYEGKPLHIVLTVLKNIGIVFGVMVIATLISFGLRALRFHESNFIMTYNLGVLLIAYLTNGYMYGIIASVLGVLTFNFFFTVPYYTLLAYSPEYPVTFFIMLIVAIATSTLTARVKRESQRAETREKRINILYQVEKSLLAVKNKQQVLEAAAKEIGQLFDTSVLTCAADQNGELNMRYIHGDGIFDTEIENKACSEAYQSGNPCGAGTELFSDCKAYYIPITGQSGVLGVIGIEFLAGNQLSENRRLFLDTVGTQIALVLEREQLYEKQHQTKLEIVRERLRGDLLRAVSHDLRTPLTGILGSASTMLNNYDSLHDDVKKEFLQGIYDDAEWLNNLVENILNVTRLAEGNIKLVKEMEAIEEIVAEAVSRVKKRTGRHEISISIPHELIMIPADGMLIEQVLVNLFDNAIKYTPEVSKISVSVYLKDEDVVFEVSDEGPGLPENEIPYIFNRFYKTREEEGNTRRGFALGLTICKSIIQAHGGNISVKNKPEGGLVFRFTLPAKE